MYSERFPGVQRVALRALSSYIPCSHRNINRLVMRDNKAIKIGTMDNDCARESGVAWNKGRWSCLVVIHIVAMLVASRLAVASGPGLKRGLGPARQQFGPDRIFLNSSWPGPVFNRV